MHSSKSVTSLIKTNRTMKKLSETPRTDAAYHSADYEYEGAEDEAWAFARKLERELNELKCLISNNKYNTNYESNTRIHPT